MPNYTNQFYQLEKPNVLSLQTNILSSESLQPSQVLIKQLAIGVNFIDCYHRTGLYPLAYPSGLGLEALAVVEASSDQRFQVGQYVFYVVGLLGAYSQYRIVSADQLCPLPTTTNPMYFAGNLLRGLTVEYLVKRLYSVQKNDYVLLFAAVGGVGQIALQWLNHLGAKVIAVVGNEEKANLAKQLGAWQTINYTKDSIHQTVKSLTQQRGVDVVYDSIGQATFQESLQSLRPCGLLVSYGNASGAVEAFHLGSLASHGSLFITRPSLVHYYPDSLACRTFSKEFFTLVEEGIIKLKTTSYAFNQAQASHDFIESGKNTGGLYLSHT